MSEFDPTIQCESGSRTGFCFAHQSLLEKCAIERYKYLLQLINLAEPPTRGGWPNIDTWRLIRKIAAAGKVKQGTQ